MKFVKQFCSFWYHFIVGDDWRIAALVIGGFVVTIFLTHGLNIQVWWLMPILVISSLSLSLLLETRERKK